MDFKVKFALTHDVKRHWFYDPCLLCSRHLRLATFVRPDVEVLKLKGKAVVWFLIRLVLWLEPDWLGKNKHHLTMALKAPAVGASTWTDRRLFPFNFCYEVSVNWKIPTIATHHHCPKKPHFYQHNMVKDFGLYLICYYLYPTELCVHNRSLIFSIRPNAMDTTSRAVSMPY